MACPGQEIADRSRELPSGVDDLDPRMSTKAGVHDLVVLAASVQLGEHGRRYDDVATLLQRHP